MDGQATDGTNSARETPLEPPFIRLPYCTYCGLDSDAANLTWINNGRYWLCDECDKD